MTKALTVLVTYLVGVWVVFLLLCFGLAGAVWITGEAYQAGCWVFNEIGIKGDCS
jgi:hypothetical protein